MDWYQPHLNFPAKMTYHFSQKRPFSLSNLAQTEVLHIWKCPKSIILDLRYFEMCHFKKVSCTFWWENSNVVEISRDFDFWKYLTYTLIWVQAFYPCPWGNPTPCLKLKTCVQKWVVFQLFWSSRLQLWDQGSAIIDHSPPKMTKLSKNFVKSIFFT